MTTDSTASVLRRWADRSRPPARRLVAAGGLALLAALSSLALLGGSGVLVVRAAGGGGLAALGGLLIAIELMAFLRAPLRLRERLTAHRVALGSMVRWRIWLYDHVAERTPGGLSLSSGELLDRSMEDVDALQDLYVRLALPLLSALAAGLAATIWISIVLPSAGLATLLAVLVGLGVALLIGRTADRAQAAAASARSHLARSTTDLVAGMTELAMVDGTTDGLAAVEAAAADRATIDGRLAWNRGLGIAAQVLVVGAGVIAIALLAGHAVARAQISGAAAAGITLLAVAGLEPLPGLIAAALRAPEVAESARRLEDVEAIEPTSVDGASPTPWPTGPVLIALDQVCAAPGGHTRPVLDGTSFTLPSGARVALLGASGAGKSTVASVLLRFLTPTAGTVRIGEVNLQDIAGDEVRRHVALLDQSSAIFGGTLRDALRLGAPDATDDEILRMLEACQLTELLGSGAGLDQLVAERGGSLSGGQQQRLALARALLRHPDLLILDEPTVGLDAVQAGTILDVALEIAGSSTVLLITHDISEAARCDVVLWLSEGQIYQLDEEQVAALG